VIADRAFPSHKLFTTLRELDCAWTVRLRAPCPSGCATAVGRRAAWSCPWEQAIAAVVLAPQCPWFAIRPQSA
jgi:hypothetical protein